MKFAFPLLFMFMGAKTLPHITVEKYLTDQIEVTVNAAPQPENYRYILIVHLFCSEINNHYDLAVSGILPLYAHESEDYFETPLPSEVEGYDLVSWAPIINLTQSDSLNLQKNVTK